MYFLKKYLKNWKFILTVILILAGLFWFYDQGRNDEALFEVKKTDLRESVAITGVAKAVDFADLSFDQSGRVKAVYANVGQQIRAGEIIVLLEDDQARASLDSARVSLEYFRTLAHQSKAQSWSAESSLRDGLRDSYTRTDDAIKNYTNRLFTNGQFGVSLSDGSGVVSFDGKSLQNLLSSRKADIDKLLAEWKNETISYGVVDRSELDGKASGALDKMRNILDFLDSLTLAVNAFETSDFSYKSTVDGFKTSAATARNNVSSAIFSLTTLAREWNIARLNYDSPENIGGSLPTALAEIKQAEARVAEAEAALRKLYLVSPISGVIAKQEARIGEAVQPGQMIVSVLSPDAFEIEANVPEVQIGKVVVGNMVEIDFDAYPGVPYAGRVSYVELSENVIGGVVGYKIKVAIDREIAERLRNGLTANLKILVTEQVNILAVPKYTISKKDGRNFVQKKDGQDFVEVEVELGLEGDGEMVEIRSGLNEGDQILLLPLKEYN